VKPSRAATALHQPAKWEFRIPVGGLVPTGGQRASLKDAHLTAAQLSYVIRPPFALTATVGVGAEP
jgi:hypothetical protein